MKKQLIATALLASSLLTLSCGGGSQTTTDTTASGDDTTTAAPEDKYLDDLPDDLNLEGKTVTFLYRNEIASEFYIESSTGDIVDDAIYDSWRSVEERLNVDIVAALMDGHVTAARDTYMNHITSTILAGDSEYDFVDLMIGNAPIRAREGIFLDLASNKYIDLSKPYYLANMVDTVGIDGKLYLISGDASLGYMKTAFCMYFNQRVADDYNLPNLYELVDNGEWTLDKVAEIATVAAQDLNGDGKYDLNDKLGFVVHDNNHPKGFFMSTSTEMYKSENDKLVYSYGTERDVAVADAVHKLIFATDGSYFPRVTNAVLEQQGTYNEVTGKFAAGDILLMTAELDDSVAGLRDMKDTYGILPYPKYDVEDDYRATARNTHNSFSMTATCADPDAAGAVLEALSSSNHETVLPAYFEIALKTKYSRDNDSARMYDLIREKMELDFIYVYNNAIGKPESVFLQAIESESSLASKVASNKTRLQTEVDKYMEDMLKIANPTT